MANNKMICLIEGTELEDDRDDCLYCPFGPGSCNYGRTRIEAKRQKYLAEQGEENKNE